MTQKIEISARTIVFTILFLILLRVLWTIREVIYALFFAFILMSALKPIVKFLERLKLPRPLAVFFVFVASVFSFGALVSFVVPPLFQESVNFFRNLPRLIATAFPNFSPFFDASSFSRFLPDITQNFFKVVGGVFSNFIFIISVIFFTFYFLLEEKFLDKFLANFLEKDLSKTIIGIFDRIEKRMGAWVWGELILMTVIGLISYLGLLLLNIKYAAPLAIMAGLLEVVPIIGPTVATIPAFFVGASVSWFTGLAVIALYFLIQQLENNLIVPLVIEKAVGLNPIITLIALIIGGKLGGLLGILLSVPTALFIETILVEFSRLKK